MSVDTMPAGREMDALVAEKVMGNDLVVRIHNDQCRRRTSGEFDPERCGLRKYSTDIAAVWEVWQKAFPVGPSDRSGFPGIIQRSDAWYCTLFYQDGQPMQTTTGERLLLAKADTAPLAICRAALKAAGV